MNQVTNNWNLKLTALVLAVALWSHVRGEVNPWETATFKVNLDRSDLPHKMIVTDGSKIPTVVTVTLRGPRLSLHEMKGPALPGPLASPDDNAGAAHGQIKATLDFGNAKRGEQNLPVKVDVKANDVEIIAVKPEDVVLTLDKAAVASFLVEPQFGPAVTTNYVMSHATVEPKTAEVSGPSNLLNKVAHVRARVRSLKAAGAVRLANISLLATTADGDVIEGLQIDPDMAMVNAQARENSIARQLRVRAHAAGEPAAGFRIGAIEVTPARIGISGAPSAFNGMTEIVVPVNIQGASRIVTQTVAVPLAKGLTATATSVTVKVHLTRIATAEQNPRNGNSNAVGKTSRQQSPFSLPSPATP